ncbi:DNA repair protein RAD51 homolog 4 isoform X2 [Eublepharis macularius]|uniref:DNA repair protein RAD51 homolog 4 isoform X2 n=1 Tax=Eublepharis macularius TaxID=481883 RepID=A0AA97LJQ0_EUBMA|nr:DNA repair protein RAD51 homolog 4 isoform X2 [Eublepharis macularius]
MILRVGLCIGLTTEMVQLLKDNGIRTVLDLVSSDLETIARKCSLSYKALVAIRRVLLAQFSSFPVNGADLYEELKSSTAILSTGSKSLDKLLDAGLYTGEVTELTGAPGSGKTQVCLHIAANISESLKQRVLYIDSTGGFTATRLLQLLQRRTENEEEQVVSASAPVKMVVVDSVSAVIYPLLGSRQPDGMAFMMHVARELKTLAKELGVAVVVTNHVTRDASCGQVKPALGRSWSFVPSTRVLLENNKESCGETSNRRIASLTKSPRQPVGIQVELDFESWEPAEDAC